MRKPVWIIGAAILLALVVAGWFAVKHALTPPRSTLAAGLTSLPEERGTPVYLTVAGGELQGIAGNGVMSFKGIPYAAPPIGALRWRAPSPAHPWRGVGANSEDILFLAPAARGP